MHQIFNARLRRPITGQRPLTEKTRQAAEQKQHAEVFLQKLKATQGRTNPAS